MTTTLQPHVDPPRLLAAIEHEKELRAAAEREVQDLRAGLYAVVDELVERALTRRRNHGFRPPTDSDLADVACNTHAYWLGVARDASTADVAE